MWLEELQKDKSWQKYVESHPDAEQNPLAEVIHAQVPTKFSSASSKTETSKPEAVPPGSNLKLHMSNSGPLAPAAPTFLTVTALVDQYEMPNIVAAWQGLNNSERLTKSRGSSNYFDLSIVKWANRRGNLIYANVLSGMCRATELEIPHKGLKSEQYVPRINDEALMNCISLRDLRELAQYELPQTSNPAQIGGKIGKEVDLSPGSLPKDPYAASIVAEALLFFALVYFAAFTREAVSSETFPVRGTLFGAFSRVRWMLFVFLIALWIPFLACSALALTSRILPVAFGIAGVLLVTISVHRTLNGKSFFASIRPSSLLAGYSWRRIRK